MSNVTNIILFFHILEDEDDRIADVNQYFLERSIRPLVSLDDPKLPRGWYGGSKMLEANLFVGAFNYLDFDGFVEHLKTIKWEEPGNVQVIVKDQDDEVFRIIRPIPGGDEFGAPEETHG